MIGVFIFHDSKTSAQTIEAIRGEISNEIYGPLTTVPIELSDLSGAEGQVQEYVDGLSSEGRFVFVGLGAAAGAVRVAASSNGQVVGLVLVGAGGFLGSTPGDGFEQVRIVGSRQDELFMLGVDSGAYSAEQLWLVDQAAYQAGETDRDISNPAFVRAIADAASPLVNSAGIEGLLRGPRPEEMGATHVSLGRRAFEAKVKCAEGTLQLSVRSLQDSTHATVSYETENEAQLDGVKATSLQPSFASAIYFIRESLLVALNQLPPNPRDGSLGVFLAALVQCWPSSD